MKPAPKWHETIPQQVMYGLAILAICCCGACFYWVENRLHEHGHGHSYTALQQKKEVADVELKRLEEELVKQKSLAEELARLTRKKVSSRSPRPYAQQEHCDAAMPTCVPCCLGGAKAAAARASRASNSPRRISVA